ncbi:MAG: GTPase HflX [Planctomycetota bacterium]
MEAGVRENQVSVEQEPAVLVGLLLPDFGGNIHDPLDELRALASSANAVVVDELLQKRSKPESKTFIGKGKVRELAELVKAHDAKVAIFENDLTPRQISNLEEACECKVIDRSELILDIFAARAQTTEARLQVELAQLEYTFPRLRAMWSHLERITGGAPTGIGTRGPGEQQLEVDRRIVRRKLAQLRDELKDVQARKSREVAARKLDHFTVGLVGYTNAGKSTLFNTLTDAGTYAHDQLFATLSTKTRTWKLGHGDDVMLSDTVGFVRDLPHHLVASFKATLEEAVHAHLLLIVLDVADPHCVDQLRTVRETLADIGAGKDDDSKTLLLLNKTDALEHNADLLVLQNENPDALPISAKTGRGLDELVEVVRTHLHGGLRETTLLIDMADGKALTFLENRSEEVLDREYLDTTVRMTIRIGGNQLERLWAMGTTARHDDQNEHAIVKRGWGR